jgi:hypothetical protein
MCYYHFICSASQNNRPKGSSPKQPPPAGLPTNPQKLLAYRDGIGRPPALSEILSITVDAISQQNARRRRHHIRTIAVPLRRSAVHGAEVIGACAKDIGRRALCVDIGCATGGVCCQVAAGVAGHGIVLQMWWNGSGRLE